MSENDYSGRKIFVITVLPPPRTGQTLVSEAMLEKMKRNFDLRVIPIRNENEISGVFWSLLKHSKIIFALIQHINFSDKRSTCYFVLDSGAGLWFNIVEAIIMRFSYSQIIFHHHVFSYFHSQSFKIKLIHRILRGRIHHIVLGKQMALGLVNHYGPAKITVLNNSPFLSDIPEMYERTSLNTIGFLGNITRSKGIELFIELANSCKGRFPEIKYVIAGPIHDKQLRDEVEDFCKIDPDHRRWLGEVKSDSKKRFLSEIDLLLFPSLYRNEALPMTIYEALAAGAPVLATDKGSISDQLRGTGWVFDESVFVSEAINSITNWKEIPCQFSRASLQATEQFRSQTRHANIALESLFAEINNNE